MKPTLAVACLAALATAHPAPADLVYFARGGEAQLPAAIDGDAVRLDTPDGPRTFPLLDFRAIVPGHRPDVEWAARRDAARQDEAIEPKFAAAWWALENGLTGQAIASIEELRPVASSHGPTLRAVRQIDALALPCPAPESDLEGLRARLRPLRVREARSPHVVLLHQLPEAEARERLDVLERVVQTFSIAFAAQGIELSGPRARLMSVHLAERRDYADLLRRVDAGAFVDTQGYYHPTLRAVFAFDARSTDDQRAGRRSTRNRKEAGEPESELARRSLLLDLDWRSADLGIAAHETIHQLTAEGGLAPRFDDLPSWLHEGLAAQFEVVRGGRWAGFGRAHDLRLPDWRSIRPAPRLAPLLRDPGLGRGYHRDRYAESWALVYYLRKTRPREFLTFLDLLRGPSPASTHPPDRSLAAFRAAFGDDLDGLESAWIAFLNDLKTPLEQGRPSKLDRASSRVDFDPQRRLVGADPPH